MSLVKQIKFGNTGIKISPIIVGCMSYGSKNWTPWVEDDKEKIFSILKHCYDRGLRTFDTADVYSTGVSEKLLGEFLRKYNIRRETVVIMTKIFFLLMILFLRVASFFPLLLRQLSTSLTSRGCLANTLWLVWPTLLRDWVPILMSYKYTDSTHILQLRRP